MLKKRRYLLNEDLIVLQKTVHEAVKCNIKNANSIMDAIYLQKIHQDCVEKGVYRNDNFWAYYSYNDFKEYYPRYICAIEETILRLLKRNLIIREFKENPKRHSPKKDKIYWYRVNYKQLQKLINKWSRKNKK
jgi:hypothetical protein